MIRLYNGKVLALNGDTEIEDKELWIQDSMILYAGPPQTDHPAFDREIDLRGDLVMPGFKNAHAHSAMTFLRSFADDLPLQTWLYDKVFPLEAKLTPDDVYALTKLAILEYLAGGITAAFDMYYKRDAFCQAAIDCGFRMVLNGALAKWDDWSVGEMDTIKYNMLHPLISYIPGIHAEYTASLELLMFMGELVHEHKKPFFTHNSETAKEVEECIERYGLTPTALYEEYGLFDYGGGGFHCTHLSSDDMDIFRRRGLWAVTCPASNAKLASGIAPVAEMMRRGINLAIGTDGPASNNALNMFREMYLVTVLQKIREKDAAVCDAARVLEMACSGGARAMGLPDCDCIAAGKTADLVALDLHRPNMYPVHNTVKNIVYSGSNDNVRMTMVNGKILYEDGVFHVGESAEDIYARAQAVTDRLCRG
ncbi:MAG: amidohydrolase [Oscillospiraceae bacterium]|nr:amidohydrolase [Oscillospiraceae bacterium]